MIDISFTYTILSLVSIVCLSFTNLSHVKRSSLRLHASSSQIEIRRINGRRCLFSPARDTISQQPQRQKLDDDISIDLSENYSSIKYPLILIGGTAQTITSWEHHIGQLSRNRDVLVYECLGQGPYPTCTDDVDPFHSNEKQV